MRRTKSILQWTVGVAVGVYLAVTLLVNLPAVQRWMANGVESVLKEMLDTRVEVGSVTLGWNGRIIVDDLCVWDQREEEMLRVARLGARVGIRDLINHRIRIGNAQVFGLYANFYQEHEGEAPNFKFAIDALASKDTTSHTPLDLHISQILIRRGNVSWEQRWKKPDSLHTARLTPSHIQLTDLNATAQLQALTDDSISLCVKRFDVCERSGLCIKSLSFNLEGTRQTARLSDLILTLPHSTLEGSAQMLRKDGEPHYTANLRARIDPADLTCAEPRLARVHDVANLALRCEGNARQLHIADIALSNGHSQMQLQASADLTRLDTLERLGATADIANLSVSAEALRPYLNSPLFDRVEYVNTRGHLSYEEGKIQGKLNVATPLGDFTTEGNATTDGAIDATLHSTGFQLGKLLQREDVGLAIFGVKARGTVGKKHDVNLDGHIEAISYRNYRYQDIALKGHLANQRYSGTIVANDPNATFEAQGNIDLAAEYVRLQANVASLAPHTLGLTKRFADTHFSGQILADLRGLNPRDVEGMAQLNDFAMSDSSGVYRPGDIHLTVRPSNEGRTLLLISPFMEAQAMGRLDPKQMMSQIRRMVSNYLPTMKQSKATGGDADGQTSFTAHIYNAAPLRRLLGIPLTLDGTVTAHGEIDSRQNALWLTLKSPGLKYGNEQLRHIDLRVESNYESMLSSMNVQRLMKGKWIDIGFDTEGLDGRLNSHLHFSNNVAGEPIPPTSYAGDVRVISRLWQDIAGRQGLESEIRPSNFTVGDTIWHIHPGFVTYCDGVLSVDSFAVSQADHYIHINGRASKSPDDVLHAELRRINLEYIFSLINFHAVELSGEATGSAYATSLFAAPKADAYIRIPQFALNYGTMGDLDIHLNWGERPYSILLDGHIDDAPHQGQTQVKGYITPKKDIAYHGIDLNVEARRVNVEFINKWTDGIFDNLQGRATGWVHIFGPFKQINIEGDAVVDEGSLGIPLIGVRYHLAGDSVTLRPDNIYFTKARIYDPQGNPGQAGHQALVDGHLHHESFKNLSYDIDIQGDNILGYDFRQLGDLNFYGTVLATGNVTLKGHPGLVNIGIKARPERGTTFTYNATSPDKITETPFVTYKPASNHEGREADVTANEGNVTTPPAQEEQGGGASSDIRIDFDLDIDPQSTMNLLTDVRSGDKITLYGSGHMLAHYYNKGTFSLYGTYRVSRGTYNLSLQEVIHKNFEFSPDGTITFNGEPYDGDLNLQAVHTVSGVSLNDINPKANFSNATTRVNCLMNIGGKARAPRITFDFDIPNANEEEKQMVRSLISTEEERNMQVVYLLGIGRFYAYDYASENQTQGTLAMNSLLSSTLSSTINQALSNMIGSSNWNFGANLRTGQDGWNDMDVEGMLQGNLLNNRLLINGNFGYRDTPVATSNFIGDFDVKYLLTRSGSVALKAYSETNDRYFTKSSLTTQGIGVQLKKDFTSWRDLIWHRKRKK